jgi:hypothetical protein
MKHNNQWSRRVVIERAGKVKEITALDAADLE